MFRREIRERKERIYLEIAQKSFFFSFFFLMRGMGAFIIKKLLHDLPYIRAKQFFQNIRQKADKKNKRSS